MLAIVKCDKCGETGKIDVGGEANTVEEAQALIDRKFKVESCPFGHHVELSPIKYTVTGIEEGAALSDEEVIAEMEAKGKKCWTDTGTLRADGVEITSFACGIPIANINGADYPLDFMTLPSGKRLYYGPAANFTDDQEATV